MKQFFSSRHLLLLPLCLLIFGLANQRQIVVAAVNSNALQDLKAVLEQKKQLDNQIKAKQEEAKKKAAEAAKAESERQRLANLIKELEFQINQTVKSQERTTQSINEKQRDIAAQEAAIAEKQEQLAIKKTETLDTVSLYYQQLQSGNSALFSLLGNESLTDYLKAQTGSTALVGFLQQQAAELEDRRVQLVDYKNTLEQQRQKLQAHKNELIALERAYASQKDQKKILESGKAEEKKRALSAADAAKQASEELKQQFAKVTGEEAALRRKLSQRSTATASRSTNPSSYGMIWPLDGLITTYFGGRTPFQSFHTGLDIAGAAGDSVVAVADGTVSVATKMCCSDFSSTVDKSYGYGNYIDLTHTGGLITRYGHLMEMLVAPGEAVKRGQVIGYRGGGIGMPGAGWSTGPHLHFEVRDGEGPDDPLRYLP